MNDNSRKSGWEWLDRDTSAFLYEYLTMGAGIPEPVRKHFGFDRDYLLYEKINGMDCDEYQRQQKEGRLPDVLVVDARLTNAVEKAFESVCRRPPDPYLDRLNEELERLGRIPSMTLSMSPRLFWPNTALTGKVRQRPYAARRKRRTGNWTPALWG